jgi:hypothetical protein
MAELDLKFASPAEFRARFTVDAILATIGKSIGWR